MIPIPSTPVRARVVRKGNGCGCVWLTIIPMLAIALGFFGFFMKTTDEYACAIQTVRQSPRVVALIGEPVTPGLFAWTPFFESGGGLRQGILFTTISGPKGSGTLRAEFYRTPIGATLYMIFKAGGEELVIYDGVYPCP
ncbi:MAG: hypothetical protein QMD04_03100 [Anaerolineales bacterium]|nr:hypothetical protein [Anaerolineales bacterium]